MWDSCPRYSVDGTAPVIGGDVVVSSRIGSFNNIVQDTWIVAQSLTDGTELWSVQLPTNFSDSWWSRVLAIRDGQVYATRSGNTNFEYLYALSVADGSILWHSTALIDSYVGETPAFTDEGDVIVGNFTTILRINHTDGTTMWQASRQCLGSGGCEAAVSENRVYGLEAVNSGGGIQYVIARYDGATGDRLYGSDALRTQPFGINQLGPFVGPDGTVYAPLSNNTPGDALVALTDTGTSFSEKWRSSLPYVPFATFSTGPDGSVYSFSPDSEMLRLDPGTGNVLSTSEVIPFDSVGVLTPHVAVDARGRVFLNNGANSQGMLYAFDADLRRRWNAAFPAINEGGPAIGGAGTLLVSGIGFTFRAYATPFSGDAPLRVDAHTDADTVSNGNGILEPGETVLVEPSWENGIGADTALTGTEFNFGGPGSGSYVLDDPLADYGTVSAGGTNNCFDANGHCPRMTVGDPGSRPATHWDAIFDEILNTGAQRFWWLHVGASFDDVPTSSLFYPYIETLLHNNVTAGCGGSTYCPGSSVSRAQMAVFLLRSRRGQYFAPPPATGEVFQDVPADSFAADWIEELAAEGVTGGCSQSPPLYCPTDPVTRAQMAVFLLKMEHGKRFIPTPCAGLFEDVSCPDAFAADWIETLSGEGVTAGCGGGDYCPDASTTRGQMAAFLTRTFGLALYGP